MSAVTFYKKEFFIFNVGTKPHYTHHRLRYIYNGYIRSLFMQNGNLPAVLYDKILLTANYFLRSAKLFEISILRDFNPSFDDLALIMQRLADIILTLPESEDVLLSQKALDYVYLMLQMSIAIRNSDSIRLSELTKELDKKSFC